MSDIFSFSRLFRLIGNDLSLHKKTILLSAIALLIFFSLFAFSYFFVLYVGGLTLTSMAFYDVHDKQKAHLFLMLPCSNLERWLSKWFLTSIGYIVGTLLVYWISLLVTSNPLDFTPSYIWLGIG